MPVVFINQQIAQSVVADVVPVEQRPKYIGRLQACVGLGFVLGPVVVLVLNNFFDISTKVRQLFICLLTSICV